jgi:hypothetical protein
MEKFQNISFIILILIVILCFAINGCTGPTGPEGQQGVAGIDGVDGVDGNANVIVKTVTLQNSDYENGFVSYTLWGNSSLIRNAKVALIPDEDITQDIMENGVVLSYWKTPVNVNTTPTQWRGLPEKFLNFTGVYFINYTSGYQEGEMRFYYYFERNQDGTIPNVHVSTVPTLDFKYAIIDGNTLSAMVECNIDIEDVYQVEEFLNLSLR